MPTRTNKFPPVIRVFHKNHEKCGFAVKPEDSVEKNDYDLVECDRTELLRHEEMQSLYGVRVSEAIAKELGLLTLSEFDPELLSLTLKKDNGNTRKIKIRADSDDFRYVMNCFGGKFGKTHNMGLLWCQFGDYETNGWSNDEIIDFVSGHKKEDGYELFVVD
jgi:hypothetical protein